MDVVVLGVGTDDAGREQAGPQPVEIIVNGYPQIMTEIVADGSMYDLEWEIDIPRSSWVAARILPSSHTNPIFVIVDNIPIRAFRRSLQVSELARTVA